MNNDCNEKNCQNCLYYRAHYVIIATRFQPIDGHCVNSALNAKQKRTHYATHESCGYWEPDDDCKTKRNKRIEAAICDMEKHLNDIKQILEIDKR